MESSVYCQCICMHGGGPGHFYSQQGILFRKERIYLAMQPMHAVRPV